MIEVICSILFSGLDISFKAILSKYLIIFSGLDVFSINKSSNTCNERGSFSFGGINIVSNDSILFGFFFCF